MIEVFDEKYYSIREAAAMAHCSPARLYDLHKRGVLHAIPLTPAGATRWEYHATQTAIIEALKAPRPAPEATAAPAPVRDISQATLKARDEAARVILRERFGMAV